MKGIYLGAYRAHHPGYDIIYQDINGKRDLDGDMMDIDLSNYDYIIATPPCNYWSKANYRRDQSEYATKTAHLLPDIIEKLQTLGKPFIVENVKNFKLMNEFYLFKHPIFHYFVGRHTYWTNIMFNPSATNQVDDKIQLINSLNRQGGKNVHNVIELWLEVIHT